MHLVLAGLDEERRRELSANPLFAPLDEAVKGDLLDCVLDIRLGVAHKEQLDKLRPQRERQVVTLKAALATVREILGDDGFVEEIKNYQIADYALDYIDLNAVEALKRAAGPVSEIMERFGYAPDDGRQQRTRFSRWEALNLEELLRLFKIEVTMKTPSDESPNHGLALIGLLADPPVSADVVRYRLRR